MRFTRTLCCWFENKTHLRTLVSFITINICIYTCIFKQLHVQTIPGKLTNTIIKNKILLSNYEVKRKTTQEMCPDMYCGMSVHHNKLHTPPPFCLTSCGVNIAISACFVASLNKSFTFSLYLAEHSKYSTAFIFLLASSPYQNSFNTLDSSYESTVKQSANEFKAVITH